MSNEEKTARKMPWMKWYSRDALGDPKLRACEPASRGIWYDMLWLMDVNEKRGYLAENDRTLCRVLGLMPEELQQAKADLLANGVPSVDADGQWYNRRMIRDDKSRKNGSLGGNPQLIKKLELKKPDTRSQSEVEPICQPPVQPGVQPPVQPPQRNEGGSDEFPINEKQWREAVGKIEDAKHREGMAEWFLMRMANGQVFTKATADLHVAELFRIPAMERDAAIKASLLGGWKKIFAERPKDKNDGAWNPANEKEF